jgi:transcriptional regulator with XRE-family HTH domain
MPLKSYPELVAKLVQARLAEPMSQATLARRLRKPLEFVAAYESGAPVLTVEELLRIAPMLHLDAYVLLAAAMR